MDKGDKSTIMKKKLYLNTILSLLYQLIAIINGLIIPRLVLGYFGSKVNGLVSSITQMLSVISFLDLGIGSIVQVALYSPLSSRDNKKISYVYNSSKKYFDVIAKILLVYILILCIYFSYFKETGFSSIYTITLLLAISINNIAQYFFGITNTLLLNADQKIYIVTILNIITTLLNAVVTIICLYFQFSIQMLKFLSSIVFIIKPLFLTIYVKKNYNIDYKCTPPKGVLKDKWSGMIQHISTMLTNSSDYIILTIFSSLESISLYNVYVLPLNNLRLLIESFTTSYKSYFGTLIANKNKDKLIMEFKKFEIIVHFFCTVIFATIYKVLIPFVLFYTLNVHDLDYNLPIFSYFITSAYFLFSLRVVYTTIIFSAGHFRQTQIYCIIECFINLILSIVLLKFFGVAGVAMGTCISTLYRLCASAYYLKNHILTNKFSEFLKLFFTDIIAILLVVFFTMPLNVRYESFLCWIVDSLLVFIIGLMISSFVFILIYGKKLILYVKNKKNKDSFKDAV